MKYSYIALQFLVSLYGGVVLIEGGEVPYKVLAFICLHLIFCLMGQLLHKPLQRKISYGLDGVYLSLLILFHYPVFLFALVLLGFEVYLKGLSMRLNRVMSILAVAFILLNLNFVAQNWLSLVVVGVSAAIINQETKKRIQLEKVKTQLMEEISQLTLALESSKKEASQTVYMTKIDERNKLAQKLHDKLGHLLAGNVMQLEAVKLILPRDEAKGMELIGQVTESLRGGMEEIRLTLKDLKPDIGESGISKVKKLLQAFSKKTTITPHLVYEGDLECISLERWHVVAENLQETLTNFMKYSSGNAFGVDIKVMNKVIKVTFKDNGLVASQWHKSLGLRGIEERTLAVGGKLIIHTDRGFETIMLFEREG